MTYETFLNDLHAVRDRAGWFRQRADDVELADTLVEALQELDVTLEELRGRSFVKILANRRGPERT